MVEAEFLGGKLLATVLALVVVAGKNVPAVELHGLSGKAIVVHQSNHTGYLNLAGYRANPVIIFLPKKLGSVFTDFTPGGKVIGRVLAIFHAYHFCQFLDQQNERPAHGNNLHSHEHFVQDQHTGIKSGSKSTHETSPDS